MIVTQAEIDAINSKVRKRVLELPVQRGPLGELKKCPLRQGGVYHLTARVPYESYRGQAERRPTRAQAVLWLIDRCDQRVHTATITVAEKPVQQGDKWVVRFRKGEHPEIFDRDLFLSRHNDFTTIASKQTVRGDAPYCPPFAEDLRRAREKAQERRVSPQRESIQRLRDEVNTLQGSLRSMKARNKAKLIRKEIEKLAALVSVENGDTLSPSDRVHGQSPADVEGAARTSDTSPLVPLEPAA